MMNYLHYAVLTWLFFQIYQCAIQVNVPFTYEVLVVAGTFGLAVGLDFILEKFEK